MIDYDVQTRSNAKRLLASLGDELPLKCSMSYAPDDELGFAIAEILKREGVVLHCRHLTTSFDKAASFLRNGLLPWSDAIQLPDSTLAKALAYGGVSYDAAAGLLLNGAYDSRLDLSKHFSYLKTDDCVNAFLHCGKSDDCYFDSPEMLRSIAMRINSSKLRRAAAEWERNSAKVCVSFSVPVEAVDVLTGHYSFEDDGGDSIYLALAIILLSVVEGRDMPGSKIILKRGVSIPPDKLTVSTAESLVWDYPEIMH